MVPIIPPAKNLLYVIEGNSRYNQGYSSFLIIIFIESRNPVFQWRFIHPLNAAKMVETQYDRAKEGLQLHREFSFSMQGSNIEQILANSPREPFSQ